LTLSFAERYCSQALFRSTVADVSRAVVRFVGEDAVALTDFYRPSNSRARGIFPNKV
jgi:hypothetical protein